MGQDSRGWKWYAGAGDLESSRVGFRIHPLNDDSLLTAAHTNSLNERLSFLRYGPGHFFKGHMDGQLELPDGRKSRVTIQIYLNGSNSDDVEGGTTRFWDPYFHDRQKYLDVEPKIGRALIFQQRGLLHSGEMIQQGLKYTMRTDFMFEQLA